MIKISNEELVKFLIENRTDDDGDLDLMDLDFSNFEGNIYISGMMVKKNLNQDNQCVKGNLYQHNQQVEGNLVQYCQKVKGKFLNHKLEYNEEWVDGDGYVSRIKKLIPITKQELEEMGYTLKESE